MLIIEPINEVLPNLIGYYVGYGRSHDNLAWSFYLGPTTYTIYGKVANKSGNSEQHFGRLYYVKDANPAGVGVCFRCYSQGSVECQELFKFQKSLLALPHAHFVWDLYRFGFKCPELNPSRF